MLNSNNRPSRFVKAMALPVLLAVMALACSKDQGAPADKEQILQLKFSSLKLTLQKDSVKLRFANGGIKQVYFVAQKGGKDSFRIDLKEERSAIVPDGGRMVNVQFMPKTSQEIEILEPPRIEPDKQ